MNADLQAPPTARPRLGIIHLLLWMACVAMSFAFRNTYAGLYGSPQRGADMFDVVFGIGAGTAMAGAVLFAAWRLRGIAFPIHPGEFLWVLYGLAEVLHWMHQGLLLCLEIMGAISWAPTRPVIVHILRPELLWPVMCCWPVLCLKDRWWRAWFALSLVTGIVAAYFLVAYFLRLPYVHPHVGLRLVTVMGGVFIVAVMRDLLRHRKYPWTHWVGITVVVWESVAMGIWLLLRRLGYIV